MSLEFEHAGPCTVAYHQHCQMVDLLMQHCRKTMGGLNPHALPYVPSTQPIVTEESTHAKRNNKKNAESSKWHACETKKGRRYKNNNKNKQEKETKLFGNRFNRLQDMVQDDHDVAEAIEKAVDEDKHRDIIKKENEENNYDIDSAEMHTLDAETQKHVEQDNNESVQQSMNANENIDNNSNKPDDKSDEDQHECEEDSEYDEHDSEKERIAWRLANPDADSNCSESDESVESNFELWCNNRPRCKYETYSE